MACKTRLAGSLCFFNPLRHRAMPSSLPRLRWNRLHFLLAVLLLAQLTHALNFGAFFAAVMQLLVRFFPGRMNGHGQGVFYGLSSGVGGVIGALLAGQLWRFGGEAAFAVGGFIALAAFGVAWHWLLRKPRSAAQAG